jgi:ribonuclease P protein component
VTSPLGHSGDVRRVLSDGRRRTSDLLALHAITRGAEDALVRTGGRAAVPADAVRLTTVASKRVGNAVVRNRAKRMLREAARAVTWVAGQDVVLVARSATATAALPDLVAEVERLGRGIGVVAPAGVR